jgi:putative flippase GtrA
LTDVAAKPGKLARLARMVAAERRRLLMFLMVGVLNTVVGYGLFAMLFLSLQSYRMAAVLAFIGGIAFNFFSIGRLVFKSNRGSALVPFVAGYLVILGANLALLEILVAAGLHALVAQAVSLPFLVLASYLINSRMVFRARCE